MIYYRLLFAKCSSILSINCSQTAISCNWATIDLKSHHCFVLVSCLIIPGIPCQNYTDPLLAFLAWFECMNIQLAHKPYIFLSFLNCHKPYSYSLGRTPIIISKLVVRNVCHSVCPDSNHFPVQLVHFFFFSFLFSH